MLLPGVEAALLALSQMVCQEGAAEEVQVQILMVGWVVLEVDGVELLPKASREEEGEVVLLMMRRVERGEQEEVQGEHLIEEQAELHEEAEELRTEALVLRVVLQLACPVA